MITLADKSLRSVIYLAYLTEKRYKILGLVVIVEYASVSVPIYFFVVALLLFLLWS